MNLKAIIQKIASWFKMEAKAVEQEARAVETRVELAVKADASELLAAIEKHLISAQLAQVLTGSNMSTPAAAPATTPATTGNNVNTAVQLALALKAIDASLSVEAIQAATNAALAAAYPAAAAA